MFSSPSSSTISSYLNQNPVWQPPVSDQGWQTSPFKSINWQETAFTRPDWQQFSPNNNSASNKIDWQQPPFRPSDSSTSGTPSWNNREGFGSSQSTRGFNFDKAMEAVKKSTRYKDETQQQQQQQQVNTGLTVAGGGAQELGSGLYAVTPMAMSLPGSSGGGGGAGHVLGNVLGGAASGAGIGATFGAAGGPIGAGVGALAGLAAGLFG